MSSISNKMVLLAVSISAAMVFTDMTILGVALPVIQKYFDATRAQSQWVVTIFLLCVSVLSFAAGQVSDIFGHHKVFPAGVVIFVLGSFFCGISPNIAFLIFFRAVQALGFAFILIGGLGLISSYFDENKRGQAIGIMMGVGTFMMVVAPFVGGVLITLLSWHWIFFINVIFGALISYPLYQIYFSQPVNTKSQTFDWVGFILIALLVSSAVLSFKHMLVWGWFSLPALLSFTTLFCLTIIFYRYEKKQKHPLIDFTLFRITNYIPGCSIVALIQAVNFFPILFGVYIQNALGYSPFMAGILLLPSGIALTIFEYIGGVAADKYGARLPMLYGLSILFFSFSVTTCLLNTHTYLAVLPALIGYGIGISFIGAPIRTSVLNKTPKDKVGMGNAILSGARQIGGVIVFAIVSSLIVFIERWHALKSLRLAVPTITQAQSDQLLGLLSKTKSSLQQLSQYSHKLQLAIHHIILDSYVTGFFYALLIMCILFLVSFLIALSFLKK